jgi:hypothetical protein
VRSPRGQTLVIVGLGMVAVVAMVGVVIDVGMQWAANRTAQNGTDAAAHAGAVVILGHLAGSGTKTDAEVLAAITAMTDETGIELEFAQYTLADGTPIGVEVGGGGSIPSEAQGVEVIATQAHQTLLARVVGVTELTVRTDAIAVAGPLECGGGGACALLPVTFPTTIVTCDGQNKSVPTETAWTGPPGSPEYIVPLCGNNPGSVGWIDWTPPRGGVNELADQICDPDPPDIDLPNWYFVTSAGNTNASQVQSCFEEWIDKPILIPIFDDTCRNKPPANDPCDDPAPIGGSNQWYHFPNYAVFYLTAVHIQGNHKNECDPGGGNGATSCLIGRFENTALTGKVGSIVGLGSSSPSQAYAVQLIK